MKELVTALQKAVYGFLKRLALARVTLMLASNRNATLLNMVVQILGHLVLVRLTLASRLNVTAQLMAVPTLLLPARATRHLPLAHKSVLPSAPEWAGALYRFLKKATLLKMT